VSLPDYDPRGNKDVGDILEPTYPGSLEELMEVFVDWVRWHRQREPVNPGDPFTKFATRGWLVQQGVVTEAQVLGDDTTTDADDEAGAVEDRMVVVYAREMHPATTAGCSALTILELSSTKPTIATLNFDATTQEYAHVALLMPPGWPGGSFTYRVYWSHTSGGSGFGVAWNLAGNSCENDETISAVFDSGTTVTDTGGTADDMYITAESAATPIQGTLAKAGDLVFLRISRVPAHASDTLDIDARLHAIRFNLNEAQVEDASFVPPPDIDFTWNSADKHSDVTLSNADLTCTASNLGRMVRGTVGKSTGKWYFEVTFVTSATWTTAGISLSSASLATLGGATGVYVIGPAHTYSPAGSDSHGSTISAGGVAGIAVDFDAGKIWFSSNNVWVTNAGPADPATAAVPRYSSIPAGTYYPGSAPGLETVTINATLVYTPPSGFSPWS
jgi:hypothetical protein